MYVTPEQIQVANKSSVEALLAVANAQFAAFVDSDFADGLTQGRGYVLQGSWVPAKNMNIKATYFLNDRNYDTPTEADYKRLQLDLNYKF